jgi:hypothetical protein
MTENVNIPGGPPGLTFEWYSTVRRIQAFFQKDKCICTSNIDPDAYELTIRVCDRCKAQALANILQLEYEYGNIHGVVHVVDVYGREYYPQHMDGLGELLEQTILAMGGNMRVRKVEEYNFPFTGKAVVIITEKALIQYYNDDLSDRYSNANIPVQDVLKSILTTHLPDGLRLATTTELSRDVD